MKMYPDFSCCLHVVSISISTWNILKYQIKELKLIMSIIFDLETNYL